MKKNAVTIQSAIDELQRMYKLMNKKYFDNKLEKVIISIQSDHAAGAYGWMTIGKVWSTEDKQYYREVNLCAEYMTRPAEFVLTTLLHEMCHIENIENNIQDCSRSEMYHNKNFKAVAERVGLIVKHHPMYGWCITEPGDDIKKIAETECRRGCFRYKRELIYFNGKPKTTTTDENGKLITTSRSKQSTIKYICPSCKAAIRATKDLDGLIQCLKCNAIYERDKK